MSSDLQSGKMCWIEPGNIGIIKWMIIQKSLKYEQQLFRKKIKL